MMDVVSQLWVPQVAGHPGNTPNIPNVGTEALGEKQLFPWTLTDCSRSRSGSLNIHFADSGGADLVPFSKLDVKTPVAFLTVSPLDCDFLPRSQKTTEYLWGLRLGSDKLKGQSGCLGAPILIGLTTGAADYGQRTEGTRADLFNCV